MFYNVLINLWSKIVRLMSKFEGFNLKFRFKSESESEFIVIIQIRCLLDDNNVIGFQIGPPNLIY